MPLKILNKRGSIIAAEAIYAVLVDRTTEWGNPFIMRSENEREYVCDAFEAYAKWRLGLEPHWLDPLKGQHLICWCAPERCHAETLMRLANV